MVYVQNDQCHFYTVEIPLYYSVVFLTAYTSQVITYIVYVSAGISTNTDLPISLASYKMPTDEA
jgi:hypothetical protein